MSSCDLLITETDHAPTLHCTCFYTSSRTSRLYSALQGYTTGQLQLVCARAVFAQKVR